MKILIVSNSPWRKDNSFGNSFSNIFEGIEDLEIANIYCKYGKPNVGFVKKFFQITEKSLINNLLKGKPSGQEVLLEDFDDKSVIDGEKAFNIAKKHKSQLLYWLRTLIWKIGRWKSNQLIKFIDDFQPDLLFIPIYYSGYLHSINKFIKNRWNLPCVGYVSDDVYTLKQFSLSPLYWIDRLCMRPTMKKVFSWCKMVYVISNIQKEEYTKIFGDKFKVLTKCADFYEEKKIAFKQPQDVLKLIYAGNISKGRFKILDSLVEEIKKLNEDGQKFQLDIYSLSPLSKRQKKKLNVEKCSRLHPSVPYEELLKLQAESDILIHAEAFILQERLAVHQSFSTKIVDYLMMNRCIMAIGDKRCSSINYFIENKNAAVVTAKKEIGTRLKELYTNREMLQWFADKAWACGVEYHQRDKMQLMLVEDLKNTVRIEQGK